MRRPATGAGGGRRKRAKARNRGEMGYRWCRGLYGDLAAASGWGGWIGAPVPIALPRRMGLDDGLNERQGALLDRVGGTTAGRFIDVE
jgi:hypothetical protein